ncbi:MAG: hypothetical protein EOO78_06080 [Oxalobacteraceae bacterium]|nr:MAG: hypothetical protein EOO78_06080 [Oxalobacteraceae bacterium]
MARGDAFFCPGRCEAGHRLRHVRDTTCVEAGAFPGGSRLGRHGSQQSKHAAVKVLLEAGANFRPEVKGGGDTAMHIAIKQGHAKCIALLRVKGAN